MSGVLDIKLSGFDELVTKLKDLDSKLQDKIVRDAMRNAFKPVLDAAKENLQANGNVDSGDLLNSLTLITKASKGGVKVSVGTFSVKNSAGKKLGKKRQARVNASVYARFIEKGTRHAKAFPFLRPALDAKRDEVLDTFTQEVDAGLKKFCASQL